jgi:hypothetical protein
MQAHRVKIGASLLLFAAPGCAPRPFGPEGGPTRAERVAALPAQAPERVMLANRAGVSPPDTSVGFAARDGRTIVLRHTPPDNAVFVIVQVPADTSGTDSVTIGLSPVPGRYGVTVTAEPRLPSGASLAFSYAIHFLAPDELPTSSYPTPARFADWLAVVRVQEDGTYRFLATARPATDLVRAPLERPGEYLVGAPVTPP